MLLTLLLGLLSVFLSWGGVAIYIFAIGGGVFIALLPTVILQVIRICKGKESVSIGELNNTHLILHAYKEAINTLYIPIDKIISIKLGEIQKRRCGDVIIKITERSKPITVHKLLSPQKLIDIYSKLTSDDVKTDILQII